jgi:hypothetical protein
MKRLRGRRIALLLASALPLLADEYDPLAAATTEHESRPLSSSRPCHEHNNNSNSNDTIASSSLSPHPNNMSLCQRDSNCVSWTMQSASENELIVPFRPPWDPSCRDELIDCNINFYYSADDCHSHDDEALPSNSRVENNDADHNIVLSTTNEKEKDDATTNEASTDSLKNEESSAITSTTSAETPLSSQLPTQNNNNNNTALSLMDSVDYASKAAGALILESSPGLEGASNLLTKDKDKYAIAACHIDTDGEDNSNNNNETSSNNGYMVVIGLSEDILVKRIVLANYERYSSPFDEFTILASTAAASASPWLHLGTYRAKPTQGKQSFDLEQPAWARYLKIVFKSHHADEHYCTLSQIMVHGSTVLQGFHEQWEEEGNAEDAEAAEATAVVATESREDDGKTEASIDRTERGAEANTLLGEQLSQMSLDDMVMASENFHNLEGESCLSHGICLSTLPDLTSPNGSDPSMQWGALSAASVCLSNCQFTQASSRPWKQSSERNVQHTSTQGTDLLLAVKSVDSEQEDEARRGLTEHRFVKQIHAIMKSTGMDIHVDDLVSNLKKTATTLTSVTTQVESEAFDDNVEIDSMVMDEWGSLTVEATEVSIPAPEDLKVDGTIQESNSMLAKLVERFPSAECLGRLDLVDLKSRSLKPKPRSGGPGQEAAGAVASMEPIFKKLKDEIKSLQAVVAVQDQYAQDSLMCYQRVLLEMFMDMELTRSSYSHRLDKLEKEQGTTRRVILTFRDLLMYVLYYAAAYLAELLHTIAMKECGVLVSFLRLTLGSCIMSSGLYYTKSKLQARSFTKTVSYSKLP